jgi:hypothetical protein
MDWKMEIIESTAETPICPHCERHIDRILARKLKAHWAYDSYIFAVTARRYSVCPIARVSGWAEFTIAR